MIGPGYPRTDHDENVMMNGRFVGDDTAVHHYCLYLYDHHHPFAVDYLLQFEHFWVEVGLVFCFLFDYRLMDPSGFHLVHFENYQTLIPDHQVDQPPNVNLKK